MCILPIPTSLESKQSSTTSNIDVHTGGMQLKDGEKATVVRTILSMHWNSLDSISTDTMPSDDKSWGLYSALSWFVSLDSCCGWLSPLSSMIAGVPLAAREQAKVPLRTSQVIEDKLEPSRLERPEAIERPVAEHDKMRLKKRQMRFRHFFFSLGAHHLAMFENVVTGLPKKGAAWREPTVPRQSHSSLLQRRGMPPLEAKLPKRQVHKAKLEVANFICTVESRPRRSKAVTFKDPVSSPCDHDGPISVSSTCSTNSSSNSVKSS
eukprot:gnl/TRDRNA2_/TRDRNA2_166594_c0_seq1.p1 gnl/TRDRNA2_/TRDRNA2_166594_c0~~gnl/TRDRNA2_/TRDRNA2_166594_c0_seq1.p1  ORF type:complete len:265 (+),score=27.77 gnl/TRDRNA2_/TRDRNA2_166594_c0_seq1:90-884(+)